MANTLAGHYVLKSVETSAHGDPYRPEKVYGGSTIMTDRHIASFYHLEEGPFGYSGTYTRDGDTLLIAIEACSVLELEGKTFRWKITPLATNEFQLDGTELSTGRLIRMISVKSADSFMTR